MDERDVYNREDPSKKNTVSFEKKYLIGITVVSAVLVIVMTIIGIFIGYNMKSKGNNTIIETNPNVTINGSTSLGIGVQDVTASVEETVVQVTAQSGSSISRGSGVVYSVDKENGIGYIVTNAHVVEGVSGPSNIKVALSDASEHTATDVKMDAVTDIAIIKIEASNLKQARLGDSTKLKKGEHVVVIGNPLGTLGGSVTDGILSALDRDIVVDNKPMRLLQTNAEINPGNSGGGMFNMQGDLIGIVNAKSTSTEIEGIGFAIPINLVKEIANSLIVDGYVKGRIDSGIGVVYISNFIEMHYYFGVTSGEMPAVYVIGVAPRLGDSIKVGDKIVAVNKVSVNTLSDYNIVMEKCKVGDDVIFTVKRDGKLYDVQVKLQEARG